MTFNIRYGSAQDGPYIWKNRKPYVIEIIKKYRPQIICFQEVEKEQLTFLIESLPEFQWFGVGRDDGKEKGEFAPIFFHYSFSVEKKGCFWLSKTPNQPSMSWPPEFMPRICTWINFIAETPFAVYNTHLPLKDTPSKKSIPLLIDRIQTQSDKFPIILTGDFNFSTGTEQYNTLRSRFRDGFLEIPENRNSTLVTFHRFTGTQEPKRFDKDIRRIDFFWLSTEFKVKLCQILPDRFQEGKKTIYPSDHYPGLIELDF